VSRNRIGLIWKSFPRWFRLLVVSSVGFSLLLIGLVLLVLPGPGIPVLIAAFLVLGLEFAWAERFLHRLRKRAQSVRNFSNRTPTMTESSGHLAPNSDTPQSEPSDILNWFKKVRAGSRSHLDSNEPKSITRRGISRKYVLISISVLLIVLFLSLVTWERMLEGGMLDKTLSAEILAERNAASFPTLNSENMPDAVKGSEMEWLRENLFINISNYKRYNVGPDLNHTQGQIPPLPRTDKRVLVVGDSFVHGTGLDDMEARWGNQLQLSLNKNHKESSWRVDSYGRDNGSVMEYQEWLNNKTLERYNPDAIVISLYENDAIPSFRETRICGVATCKVGVATAHPAYRNCIAGRTGLFGNAVRVILRPKFKHVASKLLERFCDLERIAKDEELPSFEELKGGPGVNPYWSDYEDSVEDLIQQVEGIPLFVYPIRNHAGDSISTALLEPFMKRGIKVISNAETLEFLEQNSARNMDLHANPADFHSGLPVTKRYAADVATEIAKFLRASDGFTTPLSPTELITNYLPNSLVLDRKDSNFYIIEHKRGTGSPVIMETAGMDLPAQYTPCALIRKPYVLLYLKSDVKAGERFQIVAEDFESDLEFRILRYDQNGFKTVGAPEKLSADTQHIFEPGVSGTGVLISERRAQNCSLDNKIDMASFKMALSSVL